jgi:hypothetical protein
MVTLYPILLLEVDSLFIGDMTHYDGRCMERAILKKAVGIFSKPTGYGSAS